MQTRSRCHFLGRLASVAVLLWGLAGPLSGAEIPDFCFIQISDTHLSPWPEGAGDPFPKDRSTDAIRWVCEQAKQPQTLAPLNITTPKPGFIVVTGDIMEFGAISKTWDNVERSFEGLDIPVYMVCGNHDNTWNSMLHIMKKRHGGDEYSFDKYGCHFAVFDSAGLQEPLPVIEQRTLTWMAEDLSGVDKDKPVFLFCHHPLWPSSEFSQPIEPLGLLEVIRGHNVTLLLMGHGHSLSHTKLGSLNSVMGGSTFGPNTGYNIIAVKDGVLHVVYRFREEGKPMQVLFSRPLHGPSPAEIVWLAPDREGTITTDTVSLKLRLEKGQAEAITVDFNGDKERSVACKPDAQGLFTAELSVKGLMPGAHALIARAPAGDSEAIATRTVIVGPGQGGPEIKRLVRPAGFKAGPLRVGQGLILADTAGQVTLLPARGAAEPRKIIDVGMAILHAPAHKDKTLYFGAADKKLYAVGLGGKKEWERELPGSAFGTPAMDAENLYVGDLEGYVHAVRIKDGEIKWSVKHASFAIEEPLLLHQGVIYFGAWDAQVYAVNAGDGSLKWKQGAPSGQNDPKKRNRYYGAADCAGLVIGDRLYFCDRGYMLGSYSLDGKYLGDISGNIAAIGPTADGKGFYARGLSNGLTRYDGEGKPVWSSPVEAGRFPVPPTEENGKVYLCANLGKLSVFNATDGKLVWEYQATPRLKVMAPVAHGCVLGMDGSVTLFNNAR